MRFTRSIVLGMVVLAVDDSLVTGDSALLAQLQERLREQRYNVDQESLRRYFPPHRQRSCRAPR